MSASFSSCKQLDCLCQVWTWLDKHGDTPASRENFQHLVSICTIRPAKVASGQPLQRRSSDTQAAGSARRLQACAQPLLQQGSKKFVPATAIAGKPAPPVRPASAAAARQKHAANQRPSTAAPSKTMLHRTPCTCLQLVDGQYARPLQLSGLCMIMTSIS